MQLSDYMPVLRRNWIGILAFTLLGLIIAATASIMVKPTYTAQTQLFVSLQNSGTVSELQQGNTFSQARVKSYVEAAKTPAVLQPAIDSLGLEVSPSELRRHLTASADLNTVIISIAVEDSSPVQAAAIAQAVGASLVSTIETLESPAAGGPSPIKLSVVTPATAPASPSSPNTKLNLLLGTVLGLTFGIGLATLRNTLDTKVRGESDLRRIHGAPVLGGISFDGEASKRPLLTQSQPQSPRAESFRQIRTNLQFANVNHNSKSLLVTSSLPGEGKSTTATNLAIAMAQAGQSVVLIDADLRRPSVAEYLGLDRSVGLTTVLIGHAHLNEVLQPWGPDELYVLASGQIPPNPSELLGSEAMKQLLGHLEQTFDAVIIDAPPLLPVTDAAVLAQQVGGVVVVVGSSKVKTQDLQKSINALEMVKANLLGVVLNLLPAKGPDAYAHTYYKYESVSVQSSSTSRMGRNSQAASSASEDHAHSLSSGNTL